MYTYVVHQNDQIMYVCIAIQYVQLTHFYLRHCIFSVL